MHFDRASRPARPAPPPGAPSPGTGRLPRGISTPAWPSTPQGRTSLNFHTERRDSRLAAPSSLLAAIRLLRAAASPTRFSINKAHNPPHVVQCWTDFRRILTCALCFHTGERRKALRTGLGGEMQGRRTKAQKDKPEGPSHPAGRWRARVPLPPRGLLKTLWTSLHHPFRGQGAGRRAASCGVLRNCSQVAQTEEKFPTATAKDPNNDCPTPK